METHYNVHFAAQGVPIVDAAVVAAKRLLMNKVAIQNPRPVLLSEMVY